MRAVTWCGTHSVSVDNVDEPRILNPKDAIIRITTTCICGSDLHLYDGYIPTMQKGDILGHEFMGEVVEVGSAVTRIRKGMRVVVPFTIACGECFFCKSDLWSCCDNSNPNSWMAEDLFGQSPSGLYGYSHMLGGYAGGQAEYARVPFADVGCLEIPEGLEDEKVVFLTDIFPTGYQAAVNANIQPGDTVAVWGCGPVGQFAIRSCFLLGAERVIAIDHYPDRLDMAGQAGAETLNFDTTPIYDALMEMTGARGPDSCIDAVGLEAHGVTPDSLYDRFKVATMMATDRIHVIREAIRCCRKGGTISLPGVYGGLADKFPIGPAFGKGLTFNMGQTHMHKWLRPLLGRIQQGDIDPSFVITHRFNLSEAPDAYDLFWRKRDGCIKVILKP